MALFTIAIAGKLSITVIPAMVFTYEYFMLGRRGWGIWFDKLPFVLIGSFFALRTMGVQPPTQHTLDLYVVAHSLLQNLWLLTGFGEYVLYRPRPDMGGMLWVQVVYSLALLMVIILPFLLKRWIPAAVLVFIYGILFTLLPPQVLSFVHPVADRYLYFPSVIFTIFVAWVVLNLSGNIGRGRRDVGVAILIAVSGIWAWKTLSYVDEWRDPRSVWYAASFKSRDPNVFQYLGNHYQDAADRLASRLSGDAKTRAKTHRLAQNVWADDPRLDPLLEEWGAGTITGPLTRLYQEELRRLAWDQFDKTIQLGVPWIVPNLYYRRGKLEMDRGNLVNAIGEFERAYEESRKHTSAEVRQEVAVMSRYAMGVVAWRQKDYERALRLIRQAEVDQIRFRGNWVSDVSLQRERLEGIIRSQRP